ncbi:ArnT family glycosyltransferase [Gynurincola endophyticus]|uniref:ArnT family glycosyltransferase n=1 Tax=Gynurincola endophyticus TaxID=2479004 RepID=UPI000F8C98C1|nr:glycosyltransferase family 39 protein [Gynurincola endophyticus]
MNKKYLILAGFILFKFILQYNLTDPVYDLHRDEFLHLDQANHLAWGYMSVPPVTSWISWVIKLLGNSIFWIRFFPALFGALTMLVVWKAIEELKGNLFALILGAVCITFSVLPRLNLLYQPNSLDVLVWTFFYYSFIKYTNSKNTKWLFIAAITLALGFLNKYNVVFLLLGFLPALLLTEQRKVFAVPKLYVAALLGLLIVSPNLIWQYQNDFPVFQHMKELSERQLVHVKRSGFLSSQLFYFIGSLFVLISALIAFILYKPFRKYQYFAWSFIFTLAVFLYFRAKGYYAIGLYPIYIAFGSVALSVLFKKKWTPFWQSVSIAVPVLFFIPILDVSYPNKTPEYIIQHTEKYKELGLLRWEDGKDHSLPQDFADMLGWRELAHKVDSLYTAIAPSGNTLVLCDNYGQVGAINYYTKAGVRAHSFNADYVNWFDLSKPYVNLIRVKDYDHDNKELQITAPYFETAMLVDSIANPYAREYRTGIFSFTEAKIDIRKRIEQEIQETKKRE